MRFDAGASEAAKLEAMARVEAAADQAWLDAATDALSCIATRREFFTTDAVWYVLEQRHTIPPREPRAMSAVIKAGQRAGWMEKTNTFRPTVRVQAHRKPQRVWKSLIWKGRL